MILLAIGERFIRGSINKNNYLALNNRIIFHMNFSLGKKTRVMFIALANTFEIWTEQFYEEIKPQLSSPITERCTNLVPL